MLCMRACHTDRTIRAGRCGMKATPKAARAALHMWEEPCISGKEGSGAVFFSGCTLQCVFCQNREIALGLAGQEIPEERLPELFLSLEKQGANNINLVTPTQFVPSLVRQIPRAREAGLTVPVVYNTGSYETAETIRALKGLVDIYLPDLKYRDSALSARYSHAPDYFPAACAAIAEMVSQTGPPVFDRRGMMIRGTIVRHMILPGHTKDSKEILAYLHGTYGDLIYISIMNQYTPMPGIETSYPELARWVTRREYERVLDYAISLGITQAYVQEGETAKESFIPAFDGEGLL